MPRLLRGLDKTLKECHSSAQLEARSEASSNGRFDEDNLCLPEVLGR